VPVPDAPLPPPPPPQAISCTATKAISNALKIPVWKERCLMLWSSNLVSMSIIQVNLSVLGRLESRWCRNYFAKPYHAGVRSRTLMPQFIQPAITVYSRTGIESPTISGCGLQVVNPQGCIRKLASTMPAWLRLLMIGTSALQGQQGICQCRRCTHFL